jgi:putative ABC transport system ATP-binding protein
MSNKIISLTNIVKTYQLCQIKSLILKGISLSVNSGDMLAIVGASGSGKSTLMNLIGLLDIADQGEYQLQGKNIAICNDD